MRSVVGTVGSNYVFYTVLYTMKVNFINVNPRI